MLEIERIDERSRQRFLDQIKSDVVRHVFAFHDIQRDMEHTTLHAAFDDDILLGYILLYTGTDVPSVIFECGEEVAPKLIAYAPEDHFVMHTSPNLLPITTSRFPQGKPYVENWMVVTRKEANFFTSDHVRRLSGRGDAAALAKLILSREDRPKRNLKRYVDWITKMPVYGLFKEDELVSYAGSFIQLPQIWMIGGVFTHPKNRNKGYSLLATSAVTREALKNAEKAALFVRSDNYPAIRVYDKIGYRKIGDKIWVDIGTGIKP